MQIILYYFIATSQAKKISLAIVLAPNFPYYSANVNMNSHERVLTDTSLNHLLM